MSRNIPFEVLTNERLTAVEEQLSALEMLFLHQAKRHIAKAQIPEVSPQDFDQVQRANRDSRSAQHSYFIKSATQPHGGTVRLAGLIGPYQFPIEAQTAICNMMNSAMSDYRHGFKVISTGTLIPCETVGNLTVELSVFFNIVDDIADVTVAGCIPEMVSEGMNCFIDTVTKISYGISVAPDFKLPEVKLNQLSRLQALTCKLAISEVDDDDTSTPE